MGNKEKLAQAKAQRTGEVGVNKHGTLMKIVEYYSRRDVVVEFQDEHKYITHVRYDHFKEGTVKNPYDRTVNGVGFFGVGKYSAYDANGNVTPQYQTWKLMLNRVYDKYNRNRNASYADCVVCDDWLNFQTFGEWFDNNFYQVNNESMHLDKDIKKKGNKIYCPEYCIFLPETINKRFISRKSLRGKYPIGVFYSKDKQKYTALCHNGNGQQYIGDYSTSNEAFYAYKKFKEAYIKELAEQYKEYIPKEAYDALYNYKIEITD